MDGSKKKLYGIIAVLAVLVVLALVPASYYDGSIPSGRYVSDATVIGVDKSQGLVQVRLKSNGRPTDTVLVLQGKLPADCHGDQPMRIGYRKQGLYEDTGQTVDGAFQVSGNMLGALIHRLIPLEAVYGLQIVDVSSDGTVLEYYIKS